MLSSLLQRSGAASAVDQLLHYVTIVILLLLIILAMVAWTWVSSLPGPLKSLIGWAALVLAILLASELLPWQQYAVLGAQLGAMGMAWMDAHPLLVLLVLPALLLGSLFWQNPA